MDNQGELHKYFVIIFENAWNANLYKCVIQEQLWALFKLRNVYFVLSKLQLSYSYALFKNSYGPYFVIIFENAWNANLVVPFCSCFWSGVLLSRLVEF